MTEKNITSTPSLSIVIIAKNEAHNITDCVKSAAFAQEVIVLDSGSTDNTVELARQAGAIVVETGWPGYGPQNNRGLDIAKSDWIFSLDADERISAELQKEIMQAIQDVCVDGYWVPRLSQLCGQFMHHSDWWPDYTRRLVRKGKGRFTEHFLHAHMQISGNTSKLKNHLIHYSYRHLEDVLEKLNRYSSGNAKDYIARGKSGSLFKAVIHGLWAFVRTYVLKLGFLDGKLGFVLAVYNAEASYYKYLKLWLAQRK
jgi:glycosyltransferase involved in cell wall biosynthesis